MRHTTPHCRTLASTTLAALICLSVACSGSDGEDLDPLVVTTLSDVVDDSDDQISLREAISAGIDNASPVTFKAGLKGSIALSTPLLIGGGSKVEIKGPGKEIITLSGEKKVRIMQIDGVNTTLSGLTFKDGRADNVSVDAGAAILVKGGDLSVTDCAFTENVHNYQIGGGGAVTVASESAGKLTITTSSFTKNTSATRGGAILTLGSGEVALTGVTFTENGPSEANQELWGAGIFHRGANLTIKDATFDKNIAKRGALGFDTTLATLITVETSTFTQHEASELGGAIFGQRTGAMAGTQLELGIIDSSFSDNEVENGGAAIATLGADVNVSVEGTDFDKNIATASGAKGGAISTQGTLMLIDATFKENSAEFGGGISSAGKLVLGGSTFEMNSATYGGAIYTSGTSTQLNGCSFDKNTASEEGGALHLGDNELIELKMVTVTNNIAINKGGGVRVTNDASFIGTTISGNSAEFGGGVDQAAGNTLTLGAGTSITTNNATRMPYNGDIQKIGGGVCNKGDVVLQGGTVSGNTPDDFCKPDQVK